MTNAPRPARRAGSSSDLRLVLALVATALAVPGCNGGLLGATCDSSRECSADNLVCDTTARECVECLGNGDCFGEGEVCIARSCRMVTTCESSRQCPGQVCDTSRGYCVDCVSDVDCGGEQRCENSVCVDPPMACDSDRQCSELSLVCDTASHVCVECVRNEDCAEGFACSANRCARSSVECEAGVLECVGSDRFRRCQSDGTWAMPESCLAGQSCAAGLCEDTSCGEACGPDQVCVQGICQSLVCAPDCTGDETCEAGVCRCGDGPRCAPGSVCTGGACVASGCEPACDVGETCADGACRCGGGPACTGTQQCIGGACMEPTCPSCGEGESCVAGSCRCGAGPRCSSGQTCQAGMCVAVGCTPACDPGETCTAGACRCGSGSACAAGQTCVSGSCVSPTCSPACASGESCVSGSCHCGSGPACSAGQTCVSGSCITSPTCSESPCRVVSPQCGCASGQACDYSGSTRGCFAAGTRTEGQACDATNKCAAGLTCAGPSTARFCARYCASDSNCPAGGGSICAMQLTDSSGSGTVLANLCGINCDPLSGSGCRSGTTCEIRGVRSGTTQAVTWCRELGSTFPFPLPICTGTECLAGETCNAGGTACTSYCRVGFAGDCPSPQVCTAFTDHPRIGSTEYGRCE
ncbi:MAG: hypothetical protein AB7S26_01810 [Sandaracinaceae bacterium]